MKTKIWMVSLALIFTFTTMAAVPEKLPRNQEEALIMALTGTNRLSVGLSHTLQSDPKKGQSWQSFDLEPGEGSSAITNALARSQLSIGIAETREVWINLSVQNSEGRTTLSAYEGKRVVNVNGRYTLEDTSVKLRVNGRVWIDYGDETVRWVDVYEPNSSGTGYRYVGNIKVDDEGDSGFYLPINYLDRGYYFAVAVGDNWDLYYYGPDGQLLPPVEVGPVTVTATIAGLQRFVDSNVDVVVGWESLVVELVLTEDFVLFEWPMLTIKGESESGRFPKVAVMYLEGVKMGEYPLDSSGSFKHQFIAPGVYHIYFIWDPKDDPRRG